MFSKAKAVLTIESGNPELVQAQLAAFTKQVSLLYFMLMTNTVALTVTHFHAAPTYLTLYIPSVLYAVSLVRLVHWWFSRNRRYTHAEASGRRRHRRRSRRFRHRPFQPQLCARPQRLEDTLAYQAVSDTIVNGPLRKTG